IRLTYGGQWGVTMGGEVAVDLRDMNGDGLADRIIVQTWTDASGVDHSSWTVDYNVGTDFVPDPVGIYQLDPPGTSPDWWLAHGYVSSRDTALLDLNRDGRPDFVARSDTCTGGANFPEAFIFNYNTGKGVKPGPCVPDPSAAFQPLRPYGTLQMQESHTTAYNESLIDLDGDGVLDYIRAALNWTNNQYTWSFFKGHHQSRRSDLLTSVTTTLGATFTFHWAPSSDYGVASGLRVVQD